MQSLREKTIFTALASLVAILGMEAAAYALNLNQIGSFLLISEVVYLWLAFKVLFFYDLHFKIPGSVARAKYKHVGSSKGLATFLKVCMQAVKFRTEHITDWRKIGYYFNYLLLPTLVFWSAVVLLSLAFHTNTHYARTQQIIIFFSSALLIFLYWNVKEIFSRKTELVHRQLFVRMTVIKIMSSGLSYAAALGGTKYYCLNPIYFSLLVFGITFTLVFQALFQHRLNSSRNLAITFCLSLIQAFAGWLVYLHWGIYYYSAAAFLTVVYNLMWGTFHYYLDQALDFRVFCEISLVSLFIGAIILGGTNFKASIFDGCYQSSPGFILRHPVEP